eukprot:COSAG01_NODE_1564_length_9896_cov_4.868837_10_plen_44_part_00
MPNDDGDDWPQVEQHRVKIHYRGWGREDGKSKWDGTKLVLNIV